MIKVYGVNSAGVPSNILTNDIVCPKISSKEPLRKNWDYRQCKLKAEARNPCVFGCEHGQRALKEIGISEDDDNIFEGTPEEDLLAKSEKLVQFGRLKTYIQMREVVAQILRGRSLVSFEAEGMNIRTIRVNIRKMCKAANPDLYAKRPRSTHHHLGFYRKNAEAFIDNFPIVSEEEIEDYIQARKALFRASTKREFS